jgi:Kef-type K+ transport system membrane component KefB
MLKLLQAHGLDAGPMQRPLLAGAFGGVIATVPALAILIVFQSLNEPARAAGTTVMSAGGAYVGLMLLGGVLYGWLFRRAANDPWGGWLFGLAFGFVVWMLGPIPPPHSFLRHPISGQDPQKGDDDDRDDEGCGRSGPRWAHVTPAQA